MKIDRNIIKIPHRAKGGTDFICPSCVTRYLYEATVGQKKIFCSCGHSWIVDTKGRPTS